MKQIVAGACPGEGGVLRRVTAGAAWLLASQFMTKAFDLITLCVLARILSPSDFGLVAIAKTLIVIVEAVLELPLGQALVRLPELRRDHFNTAFTLSALRCITLAAVLAVLAFPFAIVYRDPRLPSLIGVLSLAPVARGLISPRMTLFAKQLNFGRDFVIELSGKAIGFAVAIIMAVSTHSYWSIAAGTVATPMTMVVVSYLFAPFRPCLSLSEWRVFAGFLGWTSAAQFVTAMNWQCDRLLLGRFTSRSELGGFSMANDLASLPEQTVIGTIRRALVPGFALVSHDGVRLRDAYAKANSAILMLCLPIMLGLALLAGPAVRFALGGKWLTAVPILQWLALSMALPLFTAPLGPLAMALDRTQAFVYRSTIEFCVKLPLVAIGAIWLGVNGVIAARILSEIAMAIFSMVLVRQLIGLSIVRQILSPWRIVASGAAMTVFLLALRPLLEGLEGIGLAVGLMGTAACAVLTYAGTVVLLCYTTCPAGPELALARQLIALGYRLIKPHPNSRAQKI